MNATQCIAVIADLTRGQAREFLGNVGRQTTLRLVRHLAAMTPAKFRGDEAFDMWRTCELESTAVAAILGGQ